MELGHPQRLVVAARVLLVRRHLRLGHVQAEPLEGAGHARGAGDGRGEPVTRTRRATHARAEAIPSVRHSSATMSRCPACRAYSASTWKQIHSSVGGSSANRPPGDGGRGEREVPQHRPGACADRLAAARQVVGRHRRRAPSTGRRASSVRVVGRHGSVGGPVAPRLGHRLGEEAPHEPALLHVQHVVEQLERRPPGRHARRALVVVRQREHAAHQSRRAPSRGSRPSAGAPRRSPTPGRGSSLTCPRPGCRRRPSAPRPSSTAAPAAARRASWGGRAGS